MSRLYSVLVSLSFPAQHFTMRLAHARPSPSQPMGLSDTFGTQAYTICLFVYLSYAPPVYLQ